MLQQTQVDRVSPTTNGGSSSFRLSRPWPTAPTGDLIKAWSGLGYNRRAIYLQKTARAVVEDTAESFRQTWPVSLDVARSRPVHGRGDCGICV